MWAPPLAQYLEESRFSVLGQSKGSQADDIPFTGIFDISGWELPPTARVITQICLLWFLHGQAIGTHNHSVAFSPPEVLIIVSRVNGVLSPSATISPR